MKSFPSCAVAGNRYFLVLSISWMTYQEGFVEGSYKRSTSSMSS